MFFMIVIPAKAGIQSILYLDPGFHRDDRREYLNSNFYFFFTIFSRQSSSMS
jgi:archaellum biogenesis protein FlaJ (TadC family)